MNLENGGFGLRFFYCPGFTKLKYMVYNFLITKP